MFSVPVFGGPGVVHGTYNGSQEDTSNTGYYTFTNVPIGIDSNNRRVVLGVFMETTSHKFVPQEQVKVNGEDVSWVGARTGNGWAIYLFVETVLGSISGTTATVTVDIDLADSVEGLRCAIVSYSVYNVEDGDAYVVGTHGDQSTLDLSGEVQAESFVIGIASADDGQGGATWTGLDTKDTDELLESDFYYTSAHQAIESYEANRTMEVTWGSSTSRERGVVSCFS
ncbi:MAG: hypothetical protein GY753_09845 [Gammaproteobacteria bacterium]|nr:hypothetical protein [Gammaproteobacteria bacterium]